MKRIPSLVVQSLVTILIGSGVTAIHLQAQEDSEVTASIPFRFTVGTESIGPGTYEFSLLSSPFLLFVRDVKTGNMEMFHVRPEHQNTFEQHGRLTFRKTEGYRVLGEVHFPGTETFSEVIQPRRAERTEAKRSAAGDSMSVAQR